MTTLSHIDVGSRAWPCDSGRVRKAFDPWPVFWFCVYTAGFAVAAFRAKEPGETAVYVVAAALIVPTGRLVSWTWRALQEEASEEDVKRLRRRLAGPWAIRAELAELLRRGPAPGRDRP